MKCFLKTALTTFCLCASTLVVADTAATPPAAKKYPAKWVFFFKLPKAQIKETSKGKLQLVISDLSQTQVFMLNDRPFYLIRKIRQTGRQVWQSFANSNYKPNAKAPATLVLDTQASEVMLSHFKLAKNSVSYDIKSATVTPLSASKPGSMQLFISADSKPLCNLMNELRHDAVSLNKLNTTS